MRKSPVMTISFDRNSTDLYSWIQMDSMAEDIKASGLVRKILRAYYEQKQKPDAGITASKTGIHPVQIR